ncbi:MAG TPA: response regulator [Rhizomicrobium sp.]
MTPPRILVAEDEFLVYLALDEELREAGYAVVGPFASLAETQEAVAREAVDLALLDINMGGEMAWPAADALMARNIPVIFLSGYGPGVLPERYQALPRLAKPFDPRLLLNEIRRALPAG